MKKMSGGMKAAMKGKGMGPKMTAGAGGATGRLEKSAAAGGKGSEKGANK
jgi:hypothetical protein